MSKTDPIAAAKAAETEKAQALYAEAEKIAADAKALREKMAAFDPEFAGSAKNANVARDATFLNYTDFVSILLSAISVLMTLIAFFLAVLGFIGWNAISNKVSDRTEAFLEDGFREGEDLHKLLESKVKEAMYKGVSQIDAEGEYDDPDEVA